MPGEVSFHTALHEPRGSRVTAWFSLWPFQSRSESALPQHGRVHPSGMPLAARHPPTASPAAVQPGTEQRQACSAPTCRRRRPMGQKGAQSGHATPERWGQQSWSHSPARAASRNEAHAWLCRPTSSGPPITLHKASLLAWHKLPGHWSSLGLFHHRPHPSSVCSRVRQPHWTPVLLALAPAVHPLRPGALAPTLPLPGVPLTSSSGRMPTTF